MNKIIKLNNKLKNRAKKINVNKYLYRGYTIKRYDEIWKGYGWCILKGDEFCINCVNVKHGKEVIDNQIAKWIAKDEEIKKREKVG